MTLKTLVLWDHFAEPSAEEGLVYRWNGYAESGPIHSLFRYVEHHAERLRRSYLAWIHDLGESRVKDQRLKDHFALADGLSYWWMTLLVEKNPWKSPSISAAIRLLALEEILLERRPDRLRLVSANRYLDEAVGGLCRNLGVAYEYERLAGKHLRQLTLTDLYRALPWPVKAVGSLARYVWAGCLLRRTDKSGWFAGDRSLFFCSYFVHLDEKSCADGRFYSRQWEGLPKLVQDRGYRTNWLQHYLRSSAVPNTRVAQDWVRRFNQRPPKNSFHSFLEAYLTVGIVLRVLRRWLRLILMNWRLRGISAAFRPSGSSLSLWPIMRADWRASLCGPVAIYNLLTIELFDKVMRDLPRQTKGLYLCENQGWERAFIHAWRKHGHGDLIAVAHSTVRFWDLRYCADPRTVRSSGPDAMPQPDVTALNGKAAIDAYLSLEYPQEAIVECEAVRYGYLAAAQRGRATQRAEAAQIRVLILGDVVLPSTIKLLRLLEAAVTHITARMTYTVKPHPYCMIEAQQFPSLSLTLLTSPLGEILHDFDVAYASNSTSAGLDAYLAGLPVVVMLDSAELNVSPLRGQPDVRFVSTPEELAAALQAKCAASGAGRDRAGFFFLDPELPRWKRLLGL